MLTDFQKEKLTHLFKAYDFQKKGELRKEEFLDLARNLTSHYEEDSKAIAELRTNLALAYYNRIAVDMDLSREGEIELPYWLRFFDEIVLPDDEELEDYIYLTVSYLFAMFDSNRDGFISYEEYENFLDILGVSRENSGETFQNMDANGDDKISRYELINALEIFFKSDDPNNKKNMIFGEVEYKDV